MILRRLPIHAIPIKLCNDNGDPCQPVLQLEVILSEPLVADMTIERLSNCRQHVNLDAV